jgi:hypothetical protein
MLDLETLATSPNAMVCAIGAVAFSREEDRLVGSFSRAIEVRTALGETDLKTITWWMQQSDEARKIFDPQVAVFTQSQALDDFAVWYKDVQAQAIWGNGVTFDNVILRNCYIQHHKKIPWPFRHDRCYRTIKNMFPNVEFIRVGTHHNALDDATSQALHLMRIYKAIANGS